MNSGALEYLLPDGIGRLQLCEAAISHLRRYRQSRPWHREAGGQLFATVTAELIYIVEATGPRRGDRRSLFGFEPNRATEQSEIKEHYAKGLHFVGDWHSHRQHRPRPSDTDIRSMSEMVRRSEHDLAGFVLVVVGTAEVPEGLHVSFHTRHGWHELSPTPCTRASSR
jgi:integrative and conjugative element protein (TIGR02256 family)